MSNNKITEKPTVQTGVLNLNGQAITIVFPKTFRRRNNTLIRINNIPTPTHYEFEMKGKDLLIDASGAMTLIKNFFDRKSQPQAKVIVFDQSGHHGYYVHLYFCDRGAGETNKKSPRIVQLQMYSRDVQIVDPFNDGPSHFKKPK